MASQLTLDRPSAQTRDQATGRAAAPGRSGGPSDPGGPPGGPAGRGCWEEWPPAAPIQTVRPADDTDGRILAPLY